MSEKALDDALFRLNQTLQQHAKRVYPPQATRHIAEQIDHLYLATGDRHLDGDGSGDDEEEWKLVGADFGECLLHHMHLAFRREISG